MRPPPSPTQALRACWHPVAFAEAIGGEPVALKLLDEPLVALARHRGAAACVSDLCIHRGTALSLGWIEGDEIVCPYHGWRYGPTASAPRIPQLADPTRVPAKARIDALRLPGAVRPDLGRARRAAVASCPTCPSSKTTAGWWSPPGRTGGTRTRPASSRTSPTSATSRGCIPACWATPSGRSCPQHTVETDGHVLHYEIVRPEAPNTDDFPVFGNEQADARRSAAAATSCTCPTRSCCGSGWGGEKGMVYFFASQPISADRCVGLRGDGRNYDLDQPPEVLQEFEDTIFNQDQRIVESQRPEQVPFDLADELHLKFDAVAVAYRRAMRAHGLATSAVRD